MHQIEEVTLGPGRLKSGLIRLAGADPSIFGRLSPSEADDFAKLGMTVLIPTALAFVAGSFTIHTLQSEPSWPLVILSGVLWGGCILGIDVAVMSNLTKLTTTGVPSQKLGVCSPQDTSKTRKRSSIGVRSGIFVALRLLVSLLLGIAVTHVLMLAVFSKAVEKMIEEKRAAAIKSINDEGRLLQLKEASLAQAEFTRTIQDDASFRVFAVLSGYRK
jgi:hypothetical protein